VRNGMPAAVRVSIPFHFSLPTADRLEAFIGRKLFTELEGETVPAELMPAWPMPKQLLAPHYPPELRGTGKRGKAVVSVVIDRQGRVMNPKLVKATWPEFGVPALAAAVSLEFPPQLNAEKKPVNVSMDVQFDFQDDGRAPKSKPADDAGKASRSEKPRNE
jgi:TonB family protein